MGKYLLTKHAIKRLKDRHISRQMFEKAVKSGVREKEGIGAIEVELAYPPITLLKDRETGWIITAYWRCSQKEKWEIAHEFYREQGRINAYEKEKEKWRRQKR